jgi:hypothetical protein
MCRGPSHNTELLLIIAFNVRICENMSCCCGIYVDLQGDRIYSGLFQSLINFYYLQNYSFSLLKVSSLPLPIITL